MTEIERKAEKSLHKFCRNCGSSKFTHWSELNADEKFIAERLAAGKFSGEEIERFQYCARCFYADESGEKSRA